MTTTLLSTYAAAGYTFAAGVDTLFITGTGGVGGTGVVGNSLVDTVSNGGVIYDGQGGIGSFGVQLTVGGWVANGGSGSIKGASGIYIGGGAGTVTNYGAISGVAGYGVVLGAGGTVTNGGTAAFGSMSGGYSGVLLSAGGTVINFGAIQGVTMAGVTLVAGGSISNGATEDLSANITGATYGVVSTGLATISNDATIQGGKDGVYLKTGGGSVTNGAYTDTKALIVGRKFGLYATGAAATVTNLATITATGDSFDYYGVSLAKGGSLTNGALTDHAALISGYRGVGAFGGPATVVNFGTIEGSGPDADGVGLGMAGTLTNGAVTDTSALISGGQGAYLVANATVTNFGAIEGLHFNGLRLGFTGTADRITNGTAKDTAALIEGYTWGVYSLAPGGLTNYGAIVGSTKGGVYVGDGGIVTNGSRTDFAARIDGYAGVKFGVAGTVLNYGTIAAGGSLGNPGVHDALGGAVTNGLASDTAALISGVTGIDMGVAGTASTAGTVINFATINGLSGYGVVLRAGGAITNGGGVDRTALIEGLIAIHADFGNAATVKNFGTVISTDATNYGIYLAGGGTVTNGSLANTTALIEGAGGVDLQAAGKATNFGTIWGASDSAGVGAYLGAGTGLTNGAAKDAKALIEGYTGILAQAGATVTNFGTVEGFGGVAVQLKAASDVLVAEAGSVFTGSILGGGGTLVLAGGVGTLASLFSAPGVTVSGSMAPTTFQAFNTVQVAAGASFTAAGPITIAAADKLIDAGTLTLSGSIANSGQVMVSGGHLIVAASGATLSGTGTIQLSGAAQISGATAAATLTNVSDLILGAGQLGAGQMVLVNQAKGVIRNLGTLLTIDTGAATIANAGFIEANAGGGVEVKSAIANTGQLRAQGGILTVDGAVSGAGAGVVQSGTLKFAATATFNENVSFIATTGTLELAHGQTYSGTVSGFSKGGSTFLELDDINSAGATASWSKATGNLTVADGTHTAVIHLAGDYTGSNFVVADDGHGHALIHDPNLRGAERPAAIPRVQPFIAAAAGFGAAAGPAHAPAADIWRGPPILASPRAAIA